MTAPALSLRLQSFQSPAWLKNVLELSAKVESLQVPGVQAE